MNVKFKETKTNKIYEDFVKEPTDRKKQRAFNKQFGNQIASKAVKLHQRLIAYPTAIAYNKVYRLRVIVSISTTKVTARLRSLGPKGRFLKKESSKI